VVSDYRHNCPERITTTHLANEQVKISLYKNHGRDELIVFIGLSVPTDAVKLFRLPDEFDNEERLFSGFMLGDKPMPRTYGQLSYKYCGRDYW